MKNVKGHKKSNVDMRRKKYKGYPFTQKHYHKKSNYQERRKKYKRYPFTQSIDIEPFPSNPPPHIHSRKLPKQKSHGEAQFDDDEKDVDEKRDCVEGWTSLFITWATTILSLKLQYLITIALSITRASFTQTRRTHGNDEFEMQKSNDRSKSKLSRRNRKRESIREIQMQWSQNTASSFPSKCSGTEDFKIVVAFLFFISLLTAFFLTMTGVAETSPIDEVEMQKETPVANVAAPVA